MEEKKENLFVKSSETLSGPVWLLHSCTLTYSMNANSLHLGYAVMNSLESYKNVNENETLIRKEAID